MVAWSPSWIDNGAYTLDGCAEWPLRVSTANPDHLQPHSAPRHAPIAPRMLLNILVRFITAHLLIHPPSARHLENLPRLHQQTTIICRAHMHHGLSVIPLVSGVGGFMATHLSSCLVPIQMPAQVRRLFGSCLPAYAQLCSMHAPTAVLLAHVGNNINYCFEFLLQPSIKDCPWLQFRQVTSASRRSPFFMLVSHRVDTSLQPDFFLFFAVSARSNFLLAWTSGSTLPPVVVLEEAFQEIPAFVSASAPSHFASPSSWQLLLDSSKHAPLPSLVSRFGPLSPSPALSDALHPLHPSSSLIRHWSSGNR
jgi:hypothetical protein